MPFDEELQRTIDSLTGRLRADLTRELQAAGAALATQAQSERDEAVQAAVAHARADAVQTTDAQIQMAVADAEARARADADAREPIRSGDLADSARLLDAVRALDRTQSLSEILDTLASCAGREAARVAVILARGAELRGWRFIGFPPEIEQAAAVIARDESGVIGEAIRTVAPASAETSGALSAPRFAALPGGRQCLA